jgi:hypothetical protein
MTTLQRLTAHRDRDRRARARLDARLRAAGYVRTARRSRTPEQAAPETLRRGPELGGAWARGVRIR